MDEPTPYRLIRSGRKTLALSMNRQGTLTVRAPLSVPQSRIDAFVREKRGWIDRTRIRMAGLPAPETLVIADGATLPCMDGALTLRLCDVRRVTRGGSELLAPQTADSTAIVRWVEAQARRALADRVAYWSKALGYGPQKLRLSRAKGRWGSMSSLGTISLNRALYLCPADIVDYVIVHEFCHIPHPDHSPAFWAQVERHMPDYRIRRDWLKAHGTLIAFLPD